MGKPEKILFLVLDGAADAPDTPTTALEQADTPGLDELASRAVCGTMYPLGPGIAPESDAAVLALLGYDPYKYYTGRGPLEALGAGMEFHEGREVAFRANFATIDPETLTIIDRRVGRSLSSEEARELAKALDGMELTDGYARVKATIGHRAVVVLGSHRGRLSGMVSNTDPAYVRRGLVSEAVKTADRRIAECKPLEETEEARETCRLVNEFTRKAIEILSSHPLNKVRREKGLPEANAILLRDAGDRLPKLPPFTALHGIESAAAIAEMPVEIGIAKAAGMRIYRVEPPTGNFSRDLPSRLEATLKALDENQFVYVHLKGPDEPGHDGSLERKKAAIEAIDRFYVQPLLEHVDLGRLAIIVTADHATPWDKKSHTGDPVPVMVSWTGFGGGVKRFTERVCAAERSVEVERGWLLLPKVLELLGWR